MGQTHVKLKVRVEDGVEVVVKAGSLVVWSDQIRLTLNYKFEFHYYSSWVGCWMGLVGVLDFIIGRDMAIFGQRWHCFIFLNYVVLSKLLFFRGAIKNKSESHYRSERKQFFSKK